VSQEYPDYPGYASGWAVAEAAPPATPAGPAGSDARRDLRLAAAVVVVLAVLGALLGVIWAQWSGPQQRAYVIAAGELYPFDEVETMAGADGRYFVLVAATGLIAGLLLWLGRRGNRGPLVALALGVGGLIGAALTWWVGYLTGGGTYDGKAGTTISHLPLSLHMHGLLFVEPALALLVYGLFAAFAVRDDLGRDDLVRQRLQASPGPVQPGLVQPGLVQPGLVEPGEYPQHRGGDGDAPRAPQQGDLPAQ